jgi:uncharacterized membrane protein
MIQLVVAALIWIGAHVGIAGSQLRAVLASRLGNLGFRAAFSVLSLLAIGFLITAYNHAPSIPLWAAPAWLRWVLAAVMLLAFVLFAGAIVAPNPTAVGARIPSQPHPHGIVRVTRHPMLWSFALWAAVHMLGNGDTASLVFFGAFLVTALAGMPSIDAKLAARDPAAWRNFAAATSSLPFRAIADGRQRFAMAEIGWLPLLVGVVLWAALLWAHPRLFGVNPLPAG